ncbi:MAG: Fic family protein [Myxococcales bacterium]|nr:Fic family protein [Myxococcales bacterium]
MPARTKKKTNKIGKKKSRVTAKPKAKVRRKPPAPAKRPAKGKAKAKAAKPKKKGKAAPTRSKAKAPSKAAKTKSRSAQKPRAKSGKPSAEALRRERARERAQAQKERQRAQKERERERAQAQKERQRAQKERERERAQAQKERERAQKEREKARARAQKELAAAREAERKAREAERQREKDEARRAKEAERLEREAERERIREEARRIKDEERARRDAERETYRKAKEVERERLRAEREAARRALEGRVARATKRAQRAGAGRASTTRVYRPDAIPNQAGTTRRLEGGRQSRPALIRPVPPPLLPPPPPPPPKEPIPQAIEDRYVLVQKRLGETDQNFRDEYAESLEMSWVYHDSALEGVVYTYQELRTAIDPGVTVVSDSSLQPVVDEIRRHRQALALVRDLGDKKRAPITVDTLKKLYLTLHPEDGDLKNLKYRKDIPQHRLYFHEYAPPDKIAYKVRQVIDWLNGPEPKKIKHPVRIAARVHYDLLRVFPFSNDSGKVARMLMTIILLRAGYPPAIIHSTERQRYYEALKSSLPTLIQMINESINNGLAGIEKRLDENDVRLRALNV